MAEAFARRIAPAGISIASAGSEPKGVHPLAIKAMAALGYDISSHRSKSIADLGHAAFDLIVTLCDSAKQSCPIFPGAPAAIHWDVEDPEATNGKNGGSDQRFLETARIIERLVTDLFTKGYYSAFIRQKKNTENILDSLTEGIIAHDLQRKIFFFSSGAERLTGFSQTEVLGRDCHEVFGSSLCGAACEFDGASGSPARIERLPYATALKKRDGTTVELEVTRMPLKNDNAEMVGVIASLNDKSRVRRHIQQQLSQTSEYRGIIGQDYTMQLIFDLIRDLGESDFSVVISGESGTGKELVARAIHDESRRAGGLFVPVNCGALPEGTLESELFGHVRGSFTGAIRDKKGRFELADGGTMFLDEVAELPPATQVKLLRVLQEGTFEAVGDEKPKKVDVRIISATNKNLKELVAKGKFREDLYYRLAVVPIEIPPLRQRKNDIKLLAESFLSQVSQKLNRKNVRFAPEALSVLVNYAWPGNVRQLQNAIQYAMVKCRAGDVDVVHLPPEIASSMPQTAEGLDAAGVKKAGRKPKLSLQAVEHALEKSGGNKAKAARMLGVGRATLYNFINENGIQAPA
jgi:sigma-54 dependent transcriptional regulator, acetoin dehydrogenase operon transcriptional activator AcoR